MQRRIPRRPSRGVFDLRPIELDLTLEEVMADLDPGWADWTTASTPGADGPPRAA